MGRGNGWMITAQCITAAGMSTGSCESVSYKSMGVLDSEYNVGFESEF